jgi:hypothetical protein
MYWTDAEREMVRLALKEVSAKLPHRTQASIIGVMRRMESGEI